jgi:hypothetical protein
MKKVAIQARHRNHFLRRGPQFDSIAWRSTPPRNDNRAASLIARRFGLSPDHAATVAHLAGIGGSNHEA